MPDAESRLTDLARRVVEATSSALPAELRESARTIPVNYCLWPPDELVADGVEEDTLGLFVGCEWADHMDGNNPHPPAILLFLGNIWQEADEDEKTFREEVRVTYLHELGHYLGLDEDELAERGLA